MTRATAAALVVALGACSAPAPPAELPLAEARRRAGDAEGAAQAYLQAQARWCGRAAWRASLACAQAQLGEGELWESAGVPERAREAYRRALVAPASDAVAATAALRLGRLELAAGRVEAAWQVLWRAVGQFPEEPAAADALRLLVSDGRGRDPRALLHALGVALTERAETALADNLLWWMADLSERELGEPAAARQLYDRIPRDTPRSGLRDDARWHAARLSRTLGDPAGAATRLRALLATREVALGAGSYFSIWLDDAQLELGRLLRDELGDPRAAAAELARLPRDYPSSILIDDALWERARAWHAAGDPRAACTALRELGQRFGSSKYAAPARELAAELSCGAAP